VTSTVDPGGIEALTFDCYGTLIDWLGGVRAAIAEASSLRGADVERLLADREEAEAAIQRGPYQDYDRVLAQSLQDAAGLQGLRVTAAEAEGFADSMGRWPPFPDSREVLARLATRYRLAILSNVMPEVLAQSVAQLGATFVTVTAGEIRSYKPARAHFDAGLERLGLERARVLHCANSLYHDIVPALELGWNVAWVNREDRPLPAGVEPHLVVPDLAALADALGC
jgi:2-haloalkanoic acid dehalogenase type II